MTDLPPYARLLGLTMERDAGGAPVLLMPFGGEVLGRPGFLHGGAIAGLLDLAATAALRHALGREDEIKPLTQTIDYRRNGRDHPTRAVGIVTRLGGRIANVDVAAWQDDRVRPIAAARMTFLIERP